jgi:hypothetical protein
VESEFWPQKTRKLLILLDAKIAENGKIHLTGTYLERDSKVIVSRKRKR